MPTIPLIQLPKSRSSEEFESMCADVLSRKYNIPFTNYGRQGQKQSGIDLVDMSKCSKHIVAQCKNYFLSSYSKLQEHITEDIKSCVELPFCIQSFVVMTSLERDVNTYNFVHNIEANFDIQVFFWEDIQAVLCEDDMLLQKYYPDFFVNTLVPIEVRNELISNAKILKQQAEYINTNCIHYRACYRYEDDCNFYNVCVSMENAAIRMSQLLDQFYIQLHNCCISIQIEKLIKEIPEFFDENSDGTGCTMVYTITNFINCFSNEKVKDEFIKLCNEIIELVTKM